MEGQDDMICPKCGSQCKEGIIFARNPRYLIIDWPAELRWHPKEDEGKIFKKGKQYLAPESEGYLCSKCNKVYAAFNVESYYDEQDEQE